MLQQRQVSVPLGLPWRITIHCSASPNGEPCPIDLIRKLHTAPPSELVDWFGSRVPGMGFSDVGYHEVIQPSGELQRGRSLSERGAHVAGENEGNIGICLIGNGRYTWRAWHALRYRIEGYQLSFGIKPWEVAVHHDFASARAQGKTCPGVPSRRIVAWLLTHNAAALSPFIHDGPIFENQAVMPQGPRGS